MRTNTYNRCSNPTQMDMIARLFSLGLSTLLCSLAFLSLGLIRSLVEIEAIGEDSWANDESVCAVIALIKRAVLLAAKKRKELDNEKARGLFFLRRRPRLVEKNTFCGSEGFCKLR